MIERYTRPEMGRIWSDLRRYETWLEVELAACRAMERKGDVPAGTADAVRARVRLDPARIADLEEKTRHDVAAFLDQVAESAGEPARWLHLGLTSSDVLDTALALQLREAFDRILGGVDSLRAALRRRADEHRGTVMAGRTHGMHAEPTTAGLVFAWVYAEMGRNRERLVRARAAVSAGKIAGVVGNYGHVDPAVEAEALSALGLVPETVATQVVSRDRHAEALGAIALCGATVEKLALQVRHWQRTEVGEAEEPFGRGQKGSSAMPHKRNPVLSENLTGLARLLRAYAGASLENVALWHERDISHSSVERVALPDATILLDFMLHRAAGLTEGLIVRPDRMRANLERTGGILFSESVLLALVRRGLTRPDAYALVQRAAASSLDGQVAFRDALAADPEVQRLLGSGLDECFDLAHHLRHVDAIYRRCFVD
jgi:adenylosuccinate lyase